MGALVPPSEVLRRAVDDLSARSGYEFRITENPVTGTDLYVVYTNTHPFSQAYDEQSGLLGFRVSSNFPDACPEDAFFIRPATVQLQAPDPVRNSSGLNRASPTDNVTTGTELGNGQVLFFSWHLWNTMKWNRKSNTLFDHYTHSIRRFEQPEHD